MAIDDISSNHYVTFDTALAAWLFSQGFELLDVEHSSFPSKFIFDNSSEALKEHVRIFQCGTAEGNILTFYRAYKKMLRMAKGNL